MILKAAPVQSSMFNVVIRDGKSVVVGQLPKGSKVQGSRVQG
jgi:hypothetical protein